jgi:transketolase
LHRFKERQAQEERSSKREVTVIIRSTLQTQPLTARLTWKALVTLDRTKYAPARGVSRGAYVLADASDHRPEVVVLPTGSEVSLCIAAYGQLKLPGTGHCHCALRGLCRHLRRARGLTRP